MFSFAHALSVVGTSLISISEVESLTISAEYKLQPLFPDIIMVLRLKFKVGRTTILFMFPPLIVASTQFPSKIIRGSSFLSNSFIKVYLTEEASAGTSLASCFSVFTSIFFMKPSSNSNPSILLWKFSHFSSLSASPLKTFKHSELPAPASHSDLIPPTHRTSFLGIEQDCKMTNPATMGTILLNFIVLFIFCSCKERQMPSQV